MFICHLMEEKILTNFSLKSSEWTRAFLALRRIFCISSWSLRGVTSWYICSAWFLAITGSIPQGFTHLGFGPRLLLPLPLLLWYMGLATTTSDKRVTASKRMNSCDVRDRRFRVIRVQATSETKQDFWNDRFIWVCAKTGHDFTPISRTHGILKLLIKSVAIACSFA